LAKSEFALTERGAADAVFGSALFEFDFLYIECASLFVSGNLGKFAKLIGGFYPVNELENPGLEEMVVKGRVGNWSAVLDGDEVRGGQGGLTGGTECAGFQTPFVVTAKLHQSEQDTVGFEEELLDLLISKAIQPAVELGELVVGEWGEFGRE
jgi:hypothetical protein